MRALAKTAWVEAKLFTREPITVVFTLGLPLVLLFVLGGVFGNQPDAEVYRGVGAMDYYIPAYVALVAASLGLVTLPTHLAGYRDRGVLRRFEASSIPLSSVFGAQVIVTVVVALLGSMLVVGAAAPTYDVHAPESLPQVVAAFLIIALAFAAIGILLGVAFPTARAAQGAGILLWFVMLIVGGAGPPPEVLSDAMRAVGDASPLSHAITLIQDPWLGFGWNAGETLAVVAYLVAAGALAALALRLTSAR